MRRSTLDEQNIYAPVGSKPWSLAITGKAKATLGSTDTSANYAWITITMARDGEAWKTLGFDSFETYLQEELKIDLGFFDRIGRAKSATNKTGKSLYQIFNSGEIETAFDEVVNGQTLGTPGAPVGNHNASKKGSPHNKGDNITFDPAQTSEAGRGTSTNYTIKRFSRDIADEKLPKERRKLLKRLLADIRAGELSVNKAAIQAGYRRKKSDYDKWLQLTRKLVDSGRHTLVELLGRAAIDLAN